MADETTAQGNEKAADKTASTARAGHNPQLESELGEELNRLGKSFVEVMKVAWNSEQRRQLEQDLKTGLNSLAANLEDGFKKVNDIPQAKEFVNKAEDVAESVADRVRKSEVAQEIGVGLLKGLRSLGAQLEKLTAELQNQDAEKSNTTSAGKPPEDIPISKG